MNHALVRSLRSPDDLVGPLGPCGESRGGAGVLCARDAGPARARRHVLYPKRVLLSAACRTFVNRGPNPARPAPASSTRHMGPVEACLLSYGAGNHVPDSVAGPENGLRPVQFLQLESWHACGEKRS